MLSPIQRLEFNLEEFKNSSEDIKKLAAFCAELLDAIKFSR
jgi:hypothetical protein